ncbi:MAG: glycosyltransferase family 4 protein [Myxococcales bacterium]|nr:glycosyltransferase family 4 protein [Myxococcales bacterium]
MKISPLKILHITRDFPPVSKGGISIAAGELVRAACLAGHDIRVCSFDAWRPKAQAKSLPLATEEQSPEGARVQRLRAPDHIARVARQWADFQPDWVHVHHGMLWQAADELVPIGPKTRRLLHVHVDQAEMNRVRGVASTLSLTAQQAALTQADVIVIPSAPAAALLLRTSPEVAGRLRVVGLGHTPLVRPVAHGNDHARRLLIVGRFDHAKGTADVIEALPTVRATFPDLQVRVVGGVPDNPRAERRWRERLEAAGGAQLSCLGWQSPASVAAEMAAADVAVFASHAETWGLALADALAAGLAVVATDVAGHRAQLSGHPPCGLLVPPGDPAALAAGVTQLLDDRALRQQLGEQAAARAQSWPAVWPAWEALLR